MIDDYFENLENRIIALTFLKFITFIALTFFYFLHTIALIF